MNYGNTYHSPWCVFCLFLTPSASASAADLPNAMQKSPAECHRENGMSCAIAQVLWLFATMMGTATVVTLHDW